MRHTLYFVLIPLCLTACPKEEEPPPKPPVLGAINVDCEDIGEAYEVVSKVTVEITDEDRDLVIDSFTGSVNGLVITLEDGDAIDDTFEWTPPSSWDPPMVCRGDFRVVIEARDATGLAINETRVVSK